jgi:hypothetical protein
MMPGQMGFERYEIMRRLISQAGFLDTCWCFCESHKKKAEQLLLCL